MEKEKNQSEDRINKRRTSFKEIQRILMQQTKFIAAGESPIEELELKYQGQEDLDQLKFILAQILTYPSTQIAELHQDANRLGELDRKRNDSEEGEEQLLKEISENSQFCPCCGFIKQEDRIKICTSIHDLNNIGVSTYLFFETITHLILLLIMSFFIYGIFSLTTNIIAANEYRVETTSFDIELKSWEGILVLSLGSKILHQTQKDKRYFEAQCWIGVALVILWGIAFIFIKLKERKGEKVLLKETKSAADFSVSFINVPTNLRQEDLQKQLYNYRNEIEELHYIENMPSMQIARFNLAKPFYLNESSFDNKNLKKINQQLSSYIQMFIEWILYRREHYEFEYSKNQRKQFYESFRKLQKKQLRILEKITQFIKQELENQSKSSTVAFVTFKESRSKEILLNLNEDDISSRIRYYLTCCSGKKYFSIEDNSGNPIKSYIKQAPEPEDIIWTNLGQEKYELAKKKLLTFLITLLVLSISLGVVFGLSKVQNDNQENRYISILISLAISLFNAIIIQVLKRLTVLERDYTTTNTQASLAIKSVLALLINSIVMPILVAKFWKKNLYGPNGLAYDVFFLGITNSFIPPLIKTFDAYFWLTRLLKWFMNRPKSKLAINQPDLNSYTEYMEFEVGYEYIYPVNLFLFACFFSPLQPIVLVFAIVGLIFLFWAQKYSLYERCRRPIPGDKAVNNAMYTLIYLGPLAYSLGSFCWSNFFQGFIGIAPNLVASIISALIFIIPYRFIVARIMGAEEEETSLYEENRIYFSNQYDRLNPSTSKAAIEEYIQFLNNFREELKNKGDKEIDNVEKMLFKQIGRGHRTQNNPVEGLLRPAFGRVQNNNANIVEGLLGVQNENPNQRLVANTILPGDHAMKMIVQNWATQKEIKNDNRGGNPFIKMVDSNFRPNKQSPQNFINDEMEEQNEEKINPSPQHQQGQQGHIYPNQQAYPYPNQYQNNSNPFWMLGNAGFNPLTFNQMNPNNFGNYNNPYGNPYSNNTSQFLNQNDQSMEGKK